MVVTRRCTDIVLQGESEDNYIQAKKQARESSVLGNGIHKSHGHTDSLQTSIVTILYVFLMFLFVIE